MRDENKIINTAVMKKGRFATVVYTKTCKTLKSCTDIITKTTKAYNVRIGTEYDSMKAVQLAKGVANKEEAHELNNGLKGKEYILYPVLLKATRSDKKYLRIETNSNTKFISTYYLNGVEINKSDILDMLLASEKKSSGDMPPVIDITLDYITEVN